MIGTEMLMGITVATFAASGLFFFKFWLSSREKFFLCFSIALWLLAIERIALLVVDEAHHAIRSPVTEASSWVYLIRLFAFLFILLAVVERNRKKLL